MKLEADHRCIMEVLEKWLLEVDSPSSSTAKESSSSSLASLGFSKPQNRHHAVLVYSV
jgi:hypothetical protein